METWFGVMVMFAVIGIGTFVIWRTVDQKFPKVKVDVRYRGTRQLTTYRLRGQTLVKDNLIDLLLNQFTYMGDITQLEFNIAPNGSRIYHAVLRYDYLIGLKDYEKNETEMLESRPTILINKSDLHSFADGKMKFSSAVLNPLKIIYVNEQLSEKTITSGKDIAARFIESEIATEKFIQSSNPIMAVLLSSIPMLIFGGMICLMIYLAITGLSDNVVKILDASAQLAEAAAKIR